MRIAYFKLVNSKPIYRSSGKKVIEIDFTKATKGITLIVGPNGSGKSTILNALNPMPDSPSLFIEGTVGEKYLVVYNGDIRYDIHIKYGNQTKAFITKHTLDIMGPRSIELNPNGNVGSYKDALVAEFQMDPIALSLTHLSIDDKGIVDKTPGDRKKYIGSKLDSIQVYNEINSAISKVVYGLKQSMDLIAADMDNIGDPDKLEVRRANTKASLDAVEEEIVKVRASMEVAKATCEALDPDNTIQKAYNDCLTKYAFEKKGLDEVNMRIPAQFINMSTKHIIPEIDMWKSGLSALEAEARSKTFIINTMAAEQDEIATELNDVNRQIALIQGESKPVSVEQDINKLRHDIELAEHFFTEVGLDTNYIPTKDEYDTAIGIIIELKNMITAIRSYSTDYILSSAVSCITEQRSPFEALQRLAEQKKALEQELEEIRSERVRFNTLLEVSAPLKDRPKTCVNDSCPFIKQALLAAKQKPEENINRLQMEFDRCSAQMTSIMADIDVANDIEQAYNDLCRLLDKVKRSRKIMAKLPTTFNKPDRDILQAILNGCAFEEEDMLSENLMNTINILVAYEYSVRTLPSLLLKQIEYEKAVNSNELATLMERNSVLNEKYLAIAANLKKTRAELFEIQRKITEAEQKVGSLTTTKINLEIKEDHTRALKEVKAEMDRLSEARDKITAAYDKAIEIKDKFKELDAKRVPIQRELDAINVGIANFRTYSVRYNDLKLRYDKALLIRDSTSPTKGGIQQLFISMYMGKTIEITNAMLSSFFEGRLSLGQYVINKNEFRIPCINAESSVVNDDISSCSSAEKSLISLLLSVALMIQSSQVYNVLRFDEIDGPLDVNNRSQFVGIIDVIRQQLNVESCFLISHSSEVELENVNVILLSDGTDPSYPITSGNIFHF